MNLASANASIKQAAANAQNNSDDIRYPVVDVGAAVEAGLDEFNAAAEGARTDEDWHQPKAARAGQREGERGEGYEVHQLVAALGRRGRRLQGPEGSDGQGECHNYGEGDVKVLAHPTECIWGEVQRQAQAFDSLNRGKVERGAISGAWGFR